MAEKKGNPAAPEASGEPKQNGKAPKTPKDPTAYHVFTRSDKTLTHVGDVTAKTPEAAVSEIVKGDSSLQEKTLVIVPDRNYKVFKFEVETTTKVKVTAA